MFPLILVEVGVVHRTGDEVSGLPAERLVTLRTPHLVAPVNLTDARTTARTWLGLFFDELRTLDILRPAFV